VNRRVLNIAAGVLLLALLAVAPLFLDGYQVVFILLTLLYIGLAYSWNLISGYTGYLSFGHVAFFGIGAYTVGVLAATHGWPWPVAVLCGGLLSAIVAVPLGWIMLRLRGPYFAIGMLAVAEGTRLLASVWRGVTRGGLGIFVSTSYNVTPVYYSLLALVVILMALTYWVDNSRFGLRLLSIREDEDAAEVLGIDTTRQKLKAFVLSAAFPGMIGGLYAWYIGYIDPGSVFALSFSLNMVLMTLLGGAGTFLGPLIGGASFAMVLETLWARFPAYHLMVSGAAIVAIVLFIPDGVVAVLRRFGLVARRRQFASRVIQRSRRRTADRTDTTEVTDAHA
jgi:branched-chain amino acid transport system permease protein